MLTLCAALALHVATATGAWSPHGLRVERLVEHEALGIDTTRPLLSWLLQPDAESKRGAPPPLDTAVRVTVSLAQLDKHGSQSDGPPLWSSGALAAMEATGSLRYGGPLLPAVTRVHWRVCCGSSACATASFVTGRKKS